MSYVLSGDVETTAGEITCRARSGDIILHPPHLPFSERSPRVGIHLWMLLDITVTPGVELFRLYPVPPVISLLPDLDYARTFAELLKVRCSPATDLLHDLRVSALTYQLCQMLLVSWQRGGAIARSPALTTPRDRFAAVITYMTEHLERKLAREELAALVHLHPGYFDRAFHEIYNLTPMRMLRNLRLQRAIQLLERSDASLSAIAYQCGLGDAGYLSRVFRERYGQTPGQYRVSIRRAGRDYLPGAPQSHGQAAVPSGVRASVHVSGSSVQG